MKKTPINNLDLCLYEETLDNGLRIFVVPKKDVNNIYTTFSTKYGSNDSCFIPNQEDKMKEFPQGIAHFLEHKVFEQKDGSEPLSFFTENGASGNANTTYTKTTYLFEGSEKFEENLNCLLDFVQAPYFTDKNVNKEKGIIEQEIKMYQDSPYDVGWDKLMKNLYVNLPYRNSIVGTVESINLITKEDLYDCYNTFYHPSNMFVVVTGNVDPLKVIHLISKNQSRKTFQKANNVIRKEYLEPDKVKKEYEVIKQNVTIPKIMIAYKFNIKDIQLPKDAISKYFSIYSDMIFGTTSLFCEELKKEEIINGTIDTMLHKTDQHMSLVIIAETFKTKELINKIEQQIKKYKLDSSEFERKLKMCISEIVQASDSYYSINEQIMKDIMTSDRVINDIYDLVKKLNIEELKTIVDNLIFDNRSILIIDSLERQ